MGGRRTDGLLYGKLLHESMPQEESPQRRCISTYSKAMADGDGVVFIPWSHA